MEKQVRFLNSACGTELDAVQAKENLKQLQEKHSYSRTLMDKLLESRICESAPEDGTSLRLEYLTVKARPYHSGISGILLETKDIRNAVKNVLDICGNCAEETLVTDIYLRYLKDQNVDYVIAEYDKYIKAKQEIIVKDNCVFAKNLLLAGMGNKGLASKFATLIFESANDLFTRPNDPIDVLFYNMHPDEKSITNKDDRTRILVDIYKHDHEKFKQIIGTNQLEGLFMHADNIRVIFGEHIPMWYFEKYGKYFQL